MPAIVILTRSTANNHTWSYYLNTQGLKTYDMPCIETEPVKPAPGLQHALAQLSQFDWLVFTSAAAIHHAANLLPKLSGNHPAIAVVGEETAAAAFTAGLPVKFQPHQANAAALARELNPIENQHILWLHGDLAAASLIQALQDRGAQVTNFIVYHTKPITHIDPHFTELLESDADPYIIFASPSAVTGFKQRINAAELKAALMLPAVATGPSTATALQQAGFANIHTSAHPTIIAVHQTLQQLLA